MAATSSVISGLLGQIRQYRQKYYLNELLKGGIVSLGILLSAFLIVNTLEYFGRFDTTVRTGLFAGFIVVLIYVVYRWILLPVVGLLDLKRTLSDETAASQIGLYFPEINDKLLNTLQLGRISDARPGGLIEASIRQKSSQLMIVRFSEAIHFNQNSKYLKYAAFPVAAAFAIFLFNPSFITGSSERILHFNRTYSDAPFSYQVLNKELKAFRNDDFTVRVALKGNALPSTVYLLQNGARFKLEKGEDRTYSYTFKNIQKETKISFEAAGYLSETYTLSVLDKPGLLSFDVALHYPPYLQKPSEMLHNVGNLTVPEGTRIEWKFNTTSTENLSLIFEGDSSVYRAGGNRDETFRLDKKAKRSAQYHIFLQNKHLPEGEKLGYFLNVIPDRFPVISSENFQDTTLYNFLIVGGSINDDYGFSNLRLFYSIHKEGESKEEKRPPRQIDIPFNKTTNTQSFYFQWYIDSLKLSPGDQIEYYTVVWDNDGVNGPKRAQSGINRFAVPSKDQLRLDIEKSGQETEAQIEKTLSKAKELEKNISALENRLKSNNELDFQERKQAEEILKKRDELLKEIQSLQEKNKTSNEKAVQLNTQKPELQQKMEQLQKLINELMNDETSKLYQELQKMLEQKQSERMSKMLERLKNKEKNNSREIERALNLFKKMQMEQKLDHVAQQLEQLAEKQEQLAENTDKDEKAKDQKENDQKENDQKNKDEKTAGNEQEKDESKQDQLGLQNDIKKEFEDIQKALKNIEDLGKEIKEKVDTREEDQKDVSEQLENSEKQLSQKKGKEAAQSQKKAAKSMRKMSSAMAEAGEGMEMQQLQEDIASLRDILENLITASFEQERLMKEIRQINLQDPRFVKLGQDQLKLQTDTRIIEDSLYALARRNVQIEAFVTRELNEMQFQMNESITAIRDRRIGVAASKQQFSMTAMNNLTLMLSDVLGRMQEMAMAMPSMGKGKSKGKSQGSEQGAGQRQERLNQKIQELSDQQRQGGGQKGLSEELARAAAEQSAIRKMIQELIDAHKGTQTGQKLGEELKELTDQMDKTETDLVNKRLNPEVIKRNKEIVTRLMESEKAMREQDEDEKRKGETALKSTRKPPAAFEQFIREKERQTELLRSVPPNFSPFYKREADAYFRKYESR